MPVFLRKAGAPHLWLFWLASIGGSMAVPARVPAAAGWLGMNDFATSLEQLKGTVREACLGQDEWPARIAAGIRGAVDFCVSNPEAAEVLVIDTKTAEGA